MYDYIFEKNVLHYKKEQLERILKDKTTVSSIFKIRIYIYAVTIPLIYIYLYILIDIFLIYPSIGIKNYI